MLFPVVFRNKMLQSQSAGNRVFRMAAELSILFGYAGNLTELQREGVQVFKEILAGII